MTTKIKSKKQLPNINNNWAAVTLVVATAILAAIILDSLKNGPIEPDWDSSIHGDYVYPTPYEGGTFTPNQDRLEEIKKKLENKNKLTDEELRFLYWMLCVYANESDRLTLWNLIAPYAAEVLMEKNWKETITHRENLLMFLLELEMTLERPQNHLEGERGVFVRKKIKELVTDEKDFVLREKNLEGHPLARELADLWFENANRNDASEQPIRDRILSLLVFWKYEGIPNEVSQEKVAKYFKKILQTE